MKKISLKRGMALLLAVSLIQAMMPFSFVQAAENSLELEIDFTAATYGTVTYSVSQDGQAIAKNNSESGDVYTINSEKTTDITVKINAVDEGYRIKEMVSGWTKDGEGFKKTLGAGDSPRQQISGDEFIEVDPDKEGTLTVDVTGNGKVSYDDNKEITSGSSEDDKSVTVSNTEAFTITPDNGNYIKSVKFDGTDVPFDRSKLSGVSYAYEYAVETNNEVKTLEVEFASLGTLDATNKEVTEYNQGLVVKTENNQKKVYVKNAISLSGTNISDGTNAFGSSISISENTAIEKMYQLNTSSTGFEDVVLAYNINVQFIVDGTSPEITMSGNSATVWVNADSADNATVSGRVNESNLESLMWGMGADCTPNQEIVPNGEGNFSITGIDASEGPVVVKLTATDKAGNTASTAVSVKVDETAPSVDTKVTYNNANNVVSKVINAIRRWFVKNETPCKIVVTLTDAESGVDVTQTVVKFGDTPLQIADGNPVQNGNEYIYTFNNVNVPTSDTVINVVAIDNVGNQIGDASNGHIRKDDKAPELFVGTQKMKDENNDGQFEYIHYFKPSAEGSTPMSINVRATDNIGLQSYSVTGDGITENSRSDYADSIVAESDFVKTTGDVAKIETASDTTDYTATFKATDLAGNESVGKVYLKKDDIAPTVSLEEITSIVDIEGETCYYTRNNKISVKLDVEDAGIGLKTVNLYDGNTKIDSTSVNGTNTEVTFSNITIRGTHTLRVEAIDALGNTTDILELLPKHNSTIKYDPTAPEVSFETTESAQDANGNPLFAGETTVKANISDVKSGITGVTYSVIKQAYDNTQSETDKQLYGVQTTGTEKGVKKTKATSKSMSKEINVDGNSNDIQLKVDVTDGTGNVITVNNIKKLSIDKTAPTIEINYDNNNVDSGNRYRADRTATITVTERNFNANDFKLNISNTAGDVPTISSWTTVVDESNPDHNTHTATVHFTADGDYTMDMSYADMAGNAANKIETQSFTIDKSAPAISVSFDNNNALNDHYFASGRTATITINEHYFDASRVSVNGTATNDGNTIAFPGVSGWSSNGDIHTASIHFATDGDYQFTVNAVDQAGNASPEYAVSQFVIDQTVPAITFSGVEDQASYNDVVEPTVTFEDVNYDNNNVNITLVGANQGQVNYGNGASDSNNGQTISFSDFEHKSDVDDIYTLTATITDMAGNSYEDSITFSVNRFGSNYELDDTLKNIQGKYVKEAIDVVFTETNVNTLAEGSSKIVVSTNGTPKTLEAGSDYQVANSGGAGSWSRYTYTISKNVFEADGTYIVSVYSEDAAGNINENSAEDKDAEITFGVDATAPVVAMTNIEENGNYNATNYEATVNVSDNLVLDNVSIELNGKAVEAKVSNDSYTFNIPESSDRQTVTVVATDAAGNELTQEVSGIIVTTNALVRFFNNTKALVGTAAGVVAVGGAGTFVFLNGGIGAFRFRPKKIKISKKQ